jgi:hypothetical protein
MVLLCALSLSEVVYVLIDDPSVNILFCVSYDSLKEAFDDPFLVIKSHNADYCPLPLFLKIQLGKSHIVFCLQAIDEAG